MEHPAKRQRQEKHIADANEVIQFHLASLADMTCNEELHPHAQTEPFPPAMCHQPFGDDEMINGYDNLRVDVWFHPSTFQAYLDIKYTDKQDGADDIYQKLQEWFDEGDLTTDKQQFMQWLRSEEQLLPDGADKLLEAAWGQQSDRLEVYHCNLHRAAHSFKKLHARLQPLLIFFIDGARYIDAEEDARWEVFIAAVRMQDKLFPVGYCTAYKYYVYPDRTRLRLSQMLILPPYQRQGVGTALLQALYKLAQQQKAVDVTVEDGGEELQLMRQRLDLTLLRARPDVQQAVSRAVSSSMAGSLAPPSPLLEALHTELRLAKGQLRLLWEALLYMQLQMQTGKGKAKLQQLIRSRIDGSATKEKHSAALKRIVDNGKKGWIMSKALGLEGSAAAPSGQGAAEEEAHRREQVAAAVAQRMQQLKSLAEALSR